MPHDSSLLDIPIYRLTHDLYYQKRADYIQINMFSGTNQDIIDKKDFYSRNHDSKIQFETYLENQYGGMWKFNEIIVYVSLYFFGNQIRGKFYFQNSKRITKTRKKTIAYRWNNILTGYSIKTSHSNKEIFDFILAGLENLKKTKFKKRFIDTSTFETIGPHIDWIRLFQDHLQR